VPLPTLGVVSTAAPTATISGTPEPSLAIPPGTGIAYKRLGDSDTVWTLGDDAQPRTLVTGPNVDGEVLISPDREWVAYSRNGDLWAVRWDGRDDRLLVHVESLATDGLPPPPPETSDVTRAIHDIAWSPDGTRLVFNTWRTGVDLTVPQAMWLEEADDLWQVAAESAEVRELLPPGAGGYFTLSPDGEWLALTTSACRRDSTEVTIAVARADGTGKRDVIHFRGSSLCVGAPDAFPRWMPDSRHFLVAILTQSLAGTPDAVEDGTDIAIYRVSVDGGLERVGRVRPWIFHGDHFDYKNIGAKSEAAWSPDLEKLALVQAVETAGTADTTTSEQSRVAETAVAGAATSGTATLGMMHPCQPSEVLRIARGDGSRPDEYDRSGWIRFLAWSTDGARFAYESGYPRCSAAGDSLVYVGESGKSPVTIAPTRETAAVQWIAPDLLIVRTAAHAGWRLELRAVDGRVRLLAENVVTWDTNRGTAARRRVY
jgi:dipeptidyl aminopeptidase/acylaminoacyl peptidase